MESFRKTKGLKSKRRPMNNKQNMLVSKRQVKQMIKTNDGEVTKKYLNTAVLNSAPASTGTLESPALPAQGVTNGQRESDSLSIDQIDIRVLLQNPEATIGVTNADCFRLIMLQARAGTVLTVSYAAAPTTGILDVGATSAIDITSHINFNAKNETFHVLMDKVVPVNFLSANACTVHSFVVKPKIKRVNFTPTTTTALCGQIYYVLQSVSGNLTCSLEQRLVYHDL
jgi:hypothetical protein